MPWFNRQDDAHRERQRQVLEPPKQANLQWVDDTWERLLNTMERLEQVTEDFTNISASRLDNHPDKGNIQEDELDVRTEVHLQIMALQRVLYPVRDEAEWMVEDFLAWFGGREKQPVGPPDEYAVPILQCIAGETFTLPRLPDAGPLSQREMMQALEALGGGLHKGDEDIQRFSENPDLEATKHRHHRGTVRRGLERLSRIDHSWVIRFIDRSERQRGRAAKARAADAPDRQGVIAAYAAATRPPDDTMPQDDITSAVEQPDQSALNNEEEGKQATERS